jgi:alkylated DNA repair dioxygenase AlkB
MNTLQSSQIKAVPLIPKRLLSQPITNQYLAVSQTAISIPYSQGSSLYIQQPSTPTYSSSTTQTPQNDSNIPQGLQHLKNFLSKELCQQILQIIDTFTWLSDLKRRVQHYGYKYSYKSRSLSSDQVPSLDSNQAIAYLRDLVKPYFETLGSKTPNQCIVNDYLESQNITPHTDASCFGPVVVTITILGETYFKMTYGTATYDIDFKEGEMLILSGESRDKWKHSTTKQGINKRRVSVTFRTVNF